MDYWFPVFCETLGWKISVGFCDYFFMVLFVICANTSDVKKITKKIECTWGNSAVQKVVKKTFKEAAKKAEKTKKIKFKETFKAFKSIFPNALK